MGIDSASPTNRGFGYLSKKPLHPEESARLPVRLPVAVAVGVRSLVCNGCREKSESAVYTEIDSAG